MVLIHELIQPLFVCNRGFLHTIFSIMSHIHCQLGIGNLVSHAQVSDINLSLAEKILIFKSLRY